MRLALPLRLLVAAWCAIGAAALANDSTATTAAGGLVLRQSADIDMRSEDLFVSVDRIRVRYVFRNRTARDVRVTVAFPMPDRDLSQMRESDVGYPSDFHSRVAGRPVAAALERHALVGGRDQTALLQGLRIPLSPDAQGTERIVRALNALRPADRDRLRRAGLIDLDADGAWPLWTVRDLWHWQQVFPTGRDLIVEHDYRPGAGSSAGTPLAFPEYRRSAEGRALLRRRRIPGEPGPAHPRRRGRDRIVGLSDRLYPHHRRQLALADRRFPAGRRQGRCAQSGQLLRARGETDQPDKVRSSPQQLAARPRPQCPDRPAGRVSDQGRGAQARRRPSGSVAGSRADTPSRIISQARSSPSAVPHQATALPPRSPTWTQARGSIAKDALSAARIADETPLAGSATMPWSCILCRPPHSISPPPSWIWVSAHWNRPSVAVPLGRAGVGAAAASANARRDAAIISSSISGRAGKASAFPTRRRGQGRLCASGTP
jgi:hypothetical protein